MMMELSQKDKELMRKEGYDHGLQIQLSVYPDFEISLACSEITNKNCGDWTLLVYRGRKEDRKEITFDIFVDPVMRANNEVPATTDNIQRAIDVCKLIYESEEQMDISWILTEYQWGDISDCWYTVKATAFTTLTAALFALGIRLETEYIHQGEDGVEFNPEVSWHSGLRFVNDTDECPSSRITRMWNLTKITKEGR
jgi:hypothetical protein